MLITGRKKNTAKIWKLGGNEACIIAGKTTNNKNI
jgi:hypothetical protein